MLNSIFVIFGAALWATDTIFRHPMIQQVSPLAVVFLEHGFALLISAISVFIFQKEKLKFHPRPIIGAAWIGLIGSALATIFYTTSFQYINPSVAILLQKTQPLIVILLSWIFLDEKLPARFFIWASVAMLAAFNLSFPDGFEFSDFQDANLIGVLLAFSASLFWAVSTIIGKSVLKKMPGSQLTLWRFLFGFLALWAIVGFSPQMKVDIPVVVTDSSILLSVFFMALVPGFLGVILYYRGLSKVKASVATLLELSFPLCAVFVNAKVLDLPIQPIQITSGIILIFAITKMNGKRS